MELHLSQLKTAYLYERAFDKFEDQKSSFRENLNDDVPKDTDWLYAITMVDILKLFYEMTLRIYGSLYVTSNSFFNEISDLHYMLNDFQSFTDLNCCFHGAFNEIKI